MGRRGGCDEGFGDRRCRVRRAHSWPRSFTGAAIRFGSSTIFEPQVHGKGSDNLRNLRTADGALVDGVELVCGDVRNASQVATALDGADAVIHLAAQVGVGQSMYEITAMSTTTAWARPSFWRSSQRQAVRQIQPRRGIFDVDLRRGRVSPARPAGDEIAVLAGCQADATAVSGSVRCSTCGSVGTPGRHAPRQSLDADLDLRDDEARPGGDVPVGGPRLRIADGRAALLQRLRPAPGADESLHRRGRDLFVAASAQPATPQWSSRTGTRPRLRPRLRHRAGDHALAHDQDEVDVEMFNVGTGVRHPC